MSSSDMKVKVHTGGTVWCIAAIVVAGFTLSYLFSVVGPILEWFFSDECLQVDANPLTFVQMGIVLAGGIVTIAVAEYGTRQAGNKWVGMAGSVMGVFLVLCSFGLAITLATPSLSCGTS